MKNNKLLRTNFLISIILLLGFAITALFAYRANYQVSIDNIEQVSSLTAEGIYYQLTAMFTKPVNISMTMANDSLLKEHLAKESQQLESENYVETIENYLDGYRKKYKFDSVFLVSSGTGRYYNFNGVDRVLERGEAENTWFFDLLDSDKEYSLNVDNDEVGGANNEITVFVNCKIYDRNSSVLGVVGVGIRVDYLMNLLKEYEEKFGLNACLIDENGGIEISTSYTGYDKRDWFEINGQEEIRDQVLNWEEDSKNLEIWSERGSQTQGASFVVSRYIPELSWNLVVEQDTGIVLKEIQSQLFRTCVIIAGVVLIVLVVITSVIRNFNRQITELVGEREKMFKKATGQLYDSIYEMNLTKNCYVGKSTEDYFASLGAGGLSLDEGLQAIADKQIKEEYKKGYVDLFSPCNAIKEFERGNNHLRYDFLIAEDDTGYHWMRIDAYMVYSEEDNSIHMFAYRQNIDDEKEKELQAATDEMTGFFTKTETERLVGRCIQNNPKKRYAFFVFDIDNFKQANDRYGHAFGDGCIRIFTRIIRSHFREGDILGRIGGDEFAVFIPVPDREWVEQKARELSCALDIIYEEQELSWHMTASIGISMSECETNFELLYRQADAALYKTKEKGKNGFTLY